MKLKKLNPQLGQALSEAGLAEANDLQSETYSSIRSGADCLVISPSGTGKTTTAMLHIIQQLSAPGEESPRALVMVADRQKVQEFCDAFESLNKYNGLRIFTVHDKSDLDDDKNMISLGIDVLVGTPTRLNEMFSTAGYNVNRLRMFIVDDADEMLKLRHESRIIRISESIPRAQRLIFSEEPTERVESLADKMLTDPHVFDFNEDEN